MTDCLIVAAGQGVRLRGKGSCKPLIEMKGVRLIERVVTAARNAGIEAFYVVSGYRGEELRAALDELAEREALSITHVINDEWHRLNGVSVHKARDFMHEPFVLTMCDHLFDPGIIRDVLARGHEPDTVTLCVDSNIETPLNDPDDVTRVKCSGGRILHIGKMIEDYNAIDTGVFLCTRAMFTAVEKSVHAGDESISGAMNVLARSGKAGTHDIGGRLWIDVDDPAAYARAEKLIEEGRL